MSETLTLASLFQLDPDRLGDEAVAALRATPDLPDLPGQLHFPEGEQLWAAASGGIARALHGALDLPLDGPLAGAWNTMRELDQYADRDAYPPDQPVLHTVSEHTIQLSQHPTVVLLANGIVIRRFTFDAVLEARIESAILLIQDAHILEIRAGSCSFTGALRYRDAVLASITSSEYRFPGAIKIPGGLAISPRAEAPAGG